MMLTCLTYTPDGELECVTDGGDLGFVDAIEEGQGYCSRGNEFGNGQGCGVEQVGVGALEMDGREVASAADAGLLEILEDAVAVGWGEGVGEANDVDKPADACVGDFERRKDETGLVGELLVVEVRDLFAACEDLGEAFHLADAESAGDLGETVVVAELGVLEPGVGGGAALIAEAAHVCGEFGAAGDDHAAFAGGDLLVGVEGEDGDVAKPADGTCAASGVDGSAEGFAGVFDERKVVALGDGYEDGHVGGNAEGVDGEDGAGTRCDGLLDGGGREIEGDGI